MYADIGECIFAYVDVLKQDLANKKGEQVTASFRECGNIDKMNFNFRSLPGPDSAVLEFATNLQDVNFLGVPQEKIYSYSYLQDDVSEFDVGEFASLVDELKAENLKVILL